MVYLIGLFLVLVAILWLAWVFYNAIQLANPSVQASITGGFFLVLTGIIAHQLNVKREIKARHFNEKREVYLKFINLVFDMLFSANSKIPLLEEEIVQRMSDFKKDLLIWGSGSMIKTWLSFEDSCNDDKSDDTIFIADKIETLLRNIRSDLGHNDFLLTQGSLYGLILKEEARREIDLLRQNKNPTTDSTI
jgi:hypothetical protein